MFVEDRLLLGQQFTVGNLLVVEYPDNSDKQLWLVTRKAIRFGQMFKYTVIEALLDVAQTLEISLDFV